MNNIILSERSCIPCQGGMPALPQEEIEKFLAELGEGWIINSFGHLYKEYRFRNFLEAMSFANKVTELSEREGHHPDLKISWGFCAVEIWTHKIQGLSVSDFVLAAKINIQCKI